MTAFLFRCDASPEIGVGHLRRSAVLAGELRVRGASVVFACRSRGIDAAGELAGAADEIVPVDWALHPEEDARLVARLARDSGAAAAVVDRYGADSEFGPALAREGIRWLQFDWAARDQVWADWILNTSPGVEGDAYRGLVRRKDARLLLGPSYALLRPQFHGRRARRAAPHGRGEKVLITLGGGDDRGGTLLCLEALRLLDAPPACTVLVGGFNPRRALIENWAGERGSGKVTVIVGERDVAVRMAEADIAVIGGGTTTFEAAAMGLPSVIVRIAGNQSLNAAAWERKGVALDAGPVEGLAPERLARLIRRLAGDGERRKTMSSAGMAIVDCRGAGRVADALQKKGMR
jgi:UDP-2,4-diacetamido-2,4,6-trideoxy-beta-L-altropyranose hydrolase